jgi:hypothetical protein
VSEPRLEKPPVEAGENAYVELSEANRRFFEHVSAHPAGLERSTYAPVHAPDPLVTYPLQSFPTFVEAGRMAEMGEVAVETCRLLAAVPERFFDGERSRLEEFYDPELDRELAFATVADPAALARIIGRGDFLDTPDGLRCVEFNLMAGLGGWEVVHVADRYLETPIVREFLEREGFRVRVPDTLVAFLDHAFAHARADGLADGGELNLVVLIDYPEEKRPGVELIRRFLTHRYRGYLAEKGGGLEGTVDVARFAELEARDGAVYHAGRRAHLVTRRSAGKLSPAVDEALLGGAAHYYQPYGEILTDKRNLALLSGAESSPAAGRFRAEELRFVRRHLPWTRIVAPGPVVWRGRETELAELLRSPERRELVIKPGQGGGGRNVYIGREVADDEWNAAVERALGEGTWVVQELVETRPYRYQRGEEGVADFSLSWGMFVFGESYGGSYLRMSPKGGSSVLNITRGAESGWVFEVEPGSGERGG